MERIKIDFSRVVGDIKPMNAVNNGPNPYTEEQTCGNFNQYKAARIPYARTHDSASCGAYGGPHIVDISYVFPDFDADPCLPESYDFILTDEYIQSIIDAGTQVFFRLGQTIEHTTKKYYVHPPKDFKKWAVICEHIIRHYNEGWANGFHHNIIYWEIWNEPNLYGYRGATSPTWTGTKEQFYDLFEISAKHLKSCFPDLKIGGPSNARGREYAVDFLTEMKKRNVPLDFYSCHRYVNDPQVFINGVIYVRQLLDEIGYTETENILNEWNYIENWSDKFVYSIKAISGIKGASYVTAIMAGCQYAGLDMLMYYDARPSTVFNGIFDLVTMEPLQTYYCLYSFSDLADLGQAVHVESDKDLYCVGATDGSRGGVLFTYFNNDDNSPKKKLSVNLDGISERSRIKIYRIDKTNDRNLVMEMVVNGPDIEVCLDMVLFDVYYVEIIPEQ